MSAVLIVIRDRIQLEKVSVEQLPFVIGRSSRCNLTLPDNMLSREHCEIARSGGVYTVVDKGSRNGTLLNGGPANKPSPLEDGDKIEVGPFELLFYASDALAPAAAAEDVEEDAATRFAGSPEDLAKADKKAEKSAEPISETASVRIELVTGPLKGSKYEDWKGDLVMGRGQNCDILIPDDSISNRHARVARDSASGRYFVEDLGSANGTFVNNVRTSGRHVLKHGEKIRVGTTVMEYHEVDPVQRKASRRKMVLTAVAVVLLIAVFKVLQPEDVTVKYMAEGQSLLQQKQYDEAINAFQRILSAHPNHAEAQAMINTARSQREAEEFLAQAKQAALEERYAEALDICHDVLRLHPKHEEATELKNVVEMVEKSKVAADAQNWPDAIRLIEKALETYPESDVLLSGLERARSEQAAETILREVQTLIAAKQYLAASEQVASVKETSAYYERAQEEAGRIGKLAEADAAYQQASRAYIGGQEAEANRLIEAGLAAVPDYPDLLRLRRDIQLIAPMTQRLGESETVLASDDVTGIREMLDNCRSVMAIRTESSEVAKVKERASELATRLQAKLKTLSQQAYDEGNAALLNKDQRGALLAYRRAAEADPENVAAASAAADLQEMLLPQAKENYQLAVVHEELGQVELALEAYLRVLEFSVPGDGYYDRALERIDRLDEN
jgi:pSer/pThr/pTyr-binding forkhead associated (FHA) protein/tetratricopeptide (TPR) repeat protein